MSLRSRFEDALVEVASELLATGESRFKLVPGSAEDVTFNLIFVSEMDRLTRELEAAGFRIWFTCEVDGVEHRLASRVDRPQVPAIHGGGQARD